VRKGIQEVGAEISKLTNAAADLTEETVGAVGEVTDLALNSQKEVIDSMQSVSAQFADRIYGGRYWTSMIQPWERWMWVSPRGVSDIYVRGLRAMTDSAVASTRMASNMLNTGIDAAKITTNYLKKNSSHIAEMTSDAAKSFGRATENYPSDNDKVQEETKDQILKKYPSAIFPSNVVLGDVQPLRVVIKSDKSIILRSPFFSNADGEIQVVSSKDKKDVSVLVIFDPVNPHFDFQGGYSRTIIVPTAKEDSKPVIFELKAKKKGSAKIRLEFYQMDYLGELNLSTNVILPDSQADIASPQLNEQEVEIKAKTEPDFSNATLIITQTDFSAKGKYDVYFLSEKFGVFQAGSISLEYEPESKFHKIFEDIQNTNLPPNEIEDRISERGLNLYEELIPDKLKDLYWRIRDDIKSIRVYSKEPWIPWEIIKPWRKLDNGERQEDEFLCERFICSRWLIGTTKETKEKIRKAKVIVPADSKLESVLAERDWLTRFLCSRKIDVSVDSSYEEVKHTLKTEGYDLIHFSSHGKHDDGMPLYSVIELEEGRKIRPESIVGMATKFGASHPIVFLNTCQSGAQGFSLTGVQSWVRKFLDSGASAFIGTLWSVSDETALKFTQELYTELSKGVTIGEAVRTARKNCKKFGDPSWLAYEFYGQPNVKIAFNDKGGKSNIA
jgi:CHAT domain